MKTYTKVRKKSLFEPSSVILDGQIPHPCYVSHTLLNLAFAKCSISIYVEIDILKC